MTRPTNPTIRSTRYSLLNDLRILRATIRDQGPGRDRSGKIAGPQRPEWMKSPAPLHGPAVAREGA